jgi:hypothetical protein
VFLGKDVPLQAGIMLEAVIKAITPKIMTWGQYAEAAYFMYQKKVLKNPSYKRYMPDYTKCMQHFALHAGMSMSQLLVPSAQPAGQLPC